MPEGLRLTNRYTALLGIDHPVVQDGMGPFRTTRLAAAVSNAGGLGSLSSPTASGPADGARELRAAIDECAALTDRPFAVNIPVDDTGHDPGQSFTRAFLSRWCSTPWRPTPRWPPGCGPSPRPRATPAASSR